MRLIWPYFAAKWRAVAPFCDGVAEWRRLSNEREELESGRSKGGDEKERASVVYEADLAELGRQVEGARAILRWGGGVATAE
jgi:hypothetical protein